MVGRAAISNPWALARIRAGMTGETTPPEPTLHDRVETALEHIRLMIQFEIESDPKDAEMRACRALRGQIPMYIKGAFGASHLRDKLTRCSSYDEFEGLLRTFEEQHQEVRDWELTS